MVKVWWCRRPTPSLHSQEDRRASGRGPVGTAFVDALKKTGLFSEVKVYDTIPDILRDVNCGPPQAGFADLPILAYNLKQGAFGDVRLVIPTSQSTSARFSIGIRKAIRLVQFNASLAKLKATAARQDSRQMGPEAKAA